MAILKIEISDADASYLERIAREDQRRLSDLLTILLADGLRYQYCEECVSIELRDDEIPADRLALIKRNEELLKQSGFWAQSEEERKAQGYTNGVSRRLSNHEDDGAGGFTDLLIEPLADRIASAALD